MKARVVGLLRILSDASGTSGYEDPVRRILQEQLGDEVRTDRSGNLFCQAAGLQSRPRVMLTAHMDEVGFVVQSITRQGLIRFIPLGGWWTHTLLAQRVRIHTRGGRTVIGVIGAKPPHFLQPDEKDRLQKIEQMLIDVGADSAAQVIEQMGIDVGDPIVPESRFQQMANPDLVMGKAFDNRVGIALMVEAIKKLRAEDLQHPNTVIAVGTVQEEVGTRGAETAVTGAEPDVAIVLEGTPADDHPDVKEDERQGALGKGVQIRLMDPSAIMNRRLVELTTNLADEHGIPHQLAVRKSGGTDAKVIHLHGAGVPTIVLGVPSRYIHTHNSILHLDDFVSGVDLIHRLILELDREATKHLTNFLA